MSLKVAAAYCMAYVAGQESPSEADVKKILESVSAPIEEEQIKSLVSQLDGKDIAALIKDGKEKLSSCAGAAPAAAGASSGAAAAATEEEAAASVEEEEEEEEDMGFDLFD
ncbi:ribosomal protein L12eI, putative [Perkinsus marinus ATCC 50983]|uniref:Ribosomal protein L12eI, putative n=1 Tax=Perkinsus marinus (strain ATCC 50983 / TXsc) TaxID=423536 RepID=C5L0N1_PERM5|nr:ribosomal protein L12eI, putative [Perkinsus marinus ATCC 50983]EER09683.1 ribosomal protein L12eI, putative [Perkinsus marinus ATCC 50983]|eukprot:XP_002777888.1 ribosomal protein L12eI, putative [Perkinsus marinus ATCC 50983]